jgi:hypothetical protein
MQNVTNSIGARMANGNSRPNVEFINNASVSNLPVSVAYELKDTVTVLTH